MRASGRSAAWLTRRMPWHRPTDASIHFSEASGGTRRTRRYRRPRLPGAAASPAQPQHLALPPSSKPLAPSLRPPKPLLHAFTPHPRRPSTRTTAAAARWWAPWASRPSWGWASAWCSTSACRRGAGGGRRRLGRGGRLGAEGRGLVGQRTAQRLRTVGHGGGPEQRARRAAGLQRRAWGARGPVWGAELAVRRACRAALGPARA